MNVFLSFVAGASLGLAVAAPIVLLLMLAGVIGS